MIAATIESLRSAHELDQAALYIRAAAVADLHLDAEAWVGAAPNADFADLARRAVAAGRVVGDEVGGVAAPLRERPDAEPFGALCLRRAGGDPDSVATLAGTLGEEIGKTYLDDLTTAVAQLRDRLIPSVGFLHDVREFAAKAATVLASAIEAKVVIWVFDSYERRLVPRYGTAPNTPVAVEVNLTLPTGTRLEGVAPAVIGKLEVFERRDVPLGWRDERITCGFADIVTVFVFHLVCAAEQELVHARLNHGARHSLQAVRASLWTLERALPDSVPPAGDQALADAVAWVEDLTWNSFSQDLVRFPTVEVRRVNLRSAVVPRLEVIARQMGRGSRSVVRLMVDRQLSRSSSDLPRVMGDSTARRRRPLAGANVL